MCVPAFRRFLPGVCSCERLYRQTAKLYGQTRTWTCSVSHKLRRLGWRLYVRHAKAFHGVNGAVHLTTGARAAQVTAGANALYSDTGANALWLTTSGIRTNDTLFDVTKRIQPEERHATESIRKHTFPDNNTSVRDLLQQERQLSRAPRSTLCRKQQLETLHLAAPSAGHTGSLRFCRSLDLVADIGMRDSAQVFPTTPPRGSTSTSSAPPHSSPESCTSAPE